MSQDLVPCFAARIKVDRGEWPEGQTCDDVPRDSEEMWSPCAACKDKVFRAWEEGGEYKCHLASDVRGDLRKDWEAGKEEEEK